MFFTVGSELDSSSFIGYHAKSLSVLTLRWHRCPSEVIITTSVVGPSEGESILRCSRVLLVAECSNVVLVLGA